MINGRSSAISKQLDLLDFNFYIESIGEHENVRPSTPSADKTPRTSASNDQLKNQSNRFSPVENLLIQYSLNQIIEELNIINKGCAKRFADVNKEIWGGRTSIKKKIEKGDMHENIFYSPTIQNMKEGMMAMFYVKISRDVDWCANVLKATQIELQRNGSYESLINTVKADRASEIEEFELIKEYMKNKKKLEYLENKLVEYKEKSNFILDDLDNHISKLESRIHDMRIQNAIQTRLIRKWEQARYEQGTLMLQKTKTHLNRELEDSQQMIDIEARAINEIENFIKYEIDKIEEQTEYWELKYNTEIDKLDDAIQVVNENITDLQRKYEEATELYEARQAEIDDYWTKKRLEAEAIALAEMMLKCAIRIQAWWRGTMVRRHLGPYRKKKKGKGGKGGKGKKK